MKKNKTFKIKRTFVSLERKIVFFLGFSGEKKNIFSLPFSERRKKICIHSLWFFRERVFSHIERSGKKIINK